MITKNCEICGAEFETQPYRILEGKGKFCSRKCYGIAKSKRPANNRIPADTDEIVRLYNQRVPVSEIATQMGCSESAIYDRIGAAGAIRSMSDSLSGLMPLEKNPNWKGGRRIDASGYVVVTTGSNKVEREHRIVVEQMLGRTLLPGEVIHHKNGIRSDNRPENLEVLPSQSEHMKKHMTTEEARRRGLRPKRRAKEEKQNSSLYRLSRRLRWHHYVQLH